MPRSGRRIDARPPQSDIAAIVAVGLNIGMLGIDEVIEHSLVYFAFECDPGKTPFDPGDMANGRMHISDFHRHPVPDTGKTIRAADFAATGGYIDHIDMDRARFHPAFHHQAKRPPV